MRTYIGQMDDDGTCRVWIDAGGVQRPLSPRYDLRRHSPAGFQWGYGGSGPAQLALAICADATGDDYQAREVYQEYKRRVVAQLQSREWRLTIADVLAAIRQIEREWEDAR